MSKYTLTPDAQAVVTMELHGGSISGDAQMAIHRDVMLTKMCIMEVRTGLKMSRHGSAFAVAKRNYGFKGSKAKVAQQMAQKLFDETGIDLRPSLVVAPRAERKNK